MPKSECQTERHAKSIQNSMEQYRKKVKHARDVVISQSHGLELTVVADPQNSYSYWGKNLGLGGLGGTRMIWMPP
jgi:hypothetical protein